MKRAKWVEVMVKTKAMKVILLQTCWKTKEAFRVSEIRLSLLIRIDPRYMREAIIRQCSRIHTATVVDLLSMKMGVEVRKCV